MCRMCEHRQMTCENCYGSRAVPDIFGDVEACPLSVIDAGETRVVRESTHQKWPSSLWS
jgi:hypothetical protein